MTHKEQFRNLLSFCIAFTKLFSVLIAVTNLQVASPLPKFFSWGMKYEKIRNQNETLLICSDIQRCKTATVPFRISWSVLRSNTAGKSLSAGCAMRTWLLGIRKIWADSHFPDVLQLSVSNT